MFHFRALRLIPDYLEGRLPVGKRSALAGHLQQCPICREKATELLGNLRPGSSSPKGRGKAEGPEQAKRVEGGEGNPKRQQA